MPSFDLLYTAASGTPSPTLSEPTSASGPNPQIVAAIIVATLALFGVLIAQGFTLWGTWRSRQESRRQFDAARDDAERHFQETRAESKRHFHETRAAQEAQFSAEQAGQRTRLLTDRFGKAAEQIGHDQPAVRLAGVYAMAALADEWTEQRQQCVDVLCAYMRLPPREQPGEDQVRSTIIHVIRQHLLDPEADDAWCQLSFNFTSATLPDNVPGFAGAAFSGDVNFSGARFTGSADFDGARFAVEGPWFLGAELPNASFCGAVFTGNPTFSFAKFTGTRSAIFSGAELTNGATFYRTRFVGVPHFNSVKTGQDIDLRTADIEVGATAESTVLDGSEFSKVQLIPANWEPEDEETRSARTRVAVEILRSIDRAGEQIDPQQQ